MIFVVARSREAETRFRRLHPGLERELKFLHGERSYCELLQKLIDSAEEDYLCVVHDDVVLSELFGERLAALVHLLNIEFPNWGLAGNAGVACFRVGYSARRLVRYVSDLHGGPNLTGHIIPAQSIDGNVMLMNIRLLRERGVKLPAFEGFQGYDLVLSIETLAVGLGVIVAPNLACWHGSGGNLRGFKSAIESPSFVEYLSSRIRNRRIETLNGNYSIPLTLTKAATQRLDLDLDALRCAVVSRPKKSVAIVVRSRFTRESMLLRTLLSIKAFVAAAGSSADFRAYVVTDAPAIPPDVKDLAEVLKLDSDPQFADSRYKLIQFAAEKIDAEFFWFVDDDDWLFPNEAERLGSCLAAAPADALIFVDTQHFSERPTPHASTALDAWHLRSAKGTMYPAIKFLASLSGTNLIPICGVIYPRAALLGIDPRAYEAVVYLEDYMTLLSVLMEQKSLPIIIDRTLAGISIHSFNQSITETDRSKWNKSMSELTSLLVMGSSTSQILSLPRSIHGSQHMIDEIMASTSWRITAPVRAAGRLLRLARARLLTRP